MAKEGSIIWTGKFGKEYKYDIYPKDTKFDAFSGNYVFMRKNDNGKFSCLYFGITNDLSERFNDHHAWNCAVRNDLTPVGTHQNDRKADREAEEKDLLDRYNTPCNIQNN